MLKDRIRADRHRVFMNSGHFAERHTWNGKPFMCVTDEEAALKRKNNNVNDISWDNNKTETLIYVPKEDFPGRAMPNETGLFDNKPFRILQVNEDMEMLCICITSNDTKAIGM